MEIRRIWAAGRQAIFLGLLMTITACDTQQSVGIQELQTVEEMDNPVDPNVEPVFELEDLSNSGLSSAIDINDHGQIIGGSLLWDKDTGLTDMGAISARAINNFGQVAGQVDGIAVYWDKDDGLLEIDTRDFSDSSSDEVRQFGISIAFDINDDGVVVGEFDFWEELYLEETNDWSIIEVFWWGFMGDKINGITRELSLFSTATAINNEGEVVVYYSPVGGREGLFVWDEQNGVRNIGVGPDGDFFHGDAHAINNHSQIVGSVLVFQSPPPAANPGLIQIQDVNNIEELLRLTNTKGIYDYGHVVEMIRNSTFESKAFPWKDEINVKMSASQTSGSTVSWNEEKQNQIIETALSSPNQSEAFIWDEQKGINSLGTLGGEWSTAWDINDHGQVVGYSQISEGKSRAFYWDEEHGMIELPTFGGNSIARAINNNGQIVGSSYDSNGQFHIVMWEVRFEPDELASN